MVVSICIFTAASFLICAGLIPAVIHFCRLYSLYDVANARKIHSGNIPRLGGVAIAASFFVCLVLCFFIDNDFSFHKALPLTCAGVMIFAFGILDDLIDMRAVFKLLVQLAASALVVANGFRFRQIFGWNLPVPAAVALTFVWIVAMINAYNLIDGLDGLCGSLSFTTLVTLGILLYGGFPEGAAVCFILSASVLGFLVFNWPPAKIFMGDGGSQLLGFMIATIPLYNNDSFEYNKFLIMLVVASFPILDTVAAVWRRLRDRRPIMSPDRLHLHHKLLNLGLGKRGALYMVIGIQLLICSTICLPVLFNRKVSTILMAASALFMIAFFTIIHYINYAVLKKMALENEMRNSGKTPEL